METSSGAAAWASLAYSRVFCGLFKLPGVVLLDLFEFAVYCVSKGLQPIFVGFGQPPQPYGKCFDLLFLQSRHPGHSLEYRVIEVLERI